MVLTICYRKLRYIAAHTPGYCRLIKGRSFLFSPAIFSLNNYSVLRQLIEIYYHMLPIHTVIKLGYMFLFCIRPATLI